MQRQVTTEEVIQVLRDASLWEGENGIKNKPDQILTKLGSGGISLSGGQTQRVSIARAMIRNPDVILLDEATSALDNKNEKLVQDALDNLARHGSALVIAHRLTTIKDSDKIVVVDKGAVVEVGTHDELLAIPIQKIDHDGDKTEIVSGFYHAQWESVMGSTQESKSSSAMASVDVQTEVSKESVEVQTDKLEMDLSYEELPSQTNLVLFRSSSVPVTSTSKILEDQKQSMPVLVSDKSMMVKEHVGI